MFHVIGLVTNIRPALLNGASILISDGFQPERTLQRLMDPALAVTHYFCVPQMAKALRESPEFSPAGLSRLTAIFTGGAPHSESEIRQWLADGILLADGFGMSEAGTVFGMPVDADRIREKAGSVGVPTPRVRARISDDNDSEAEPGNPGELQLQGDNICQGYWQREEDSANARTRDGWFRTGDIATVDEDGFYRIVGRRKDMYISGGENVYPAEVEAAVMASGLVAECAVVGVPDPRWGEAGALVLVRATGGECEPEYLGQTILDSLKGKLAPYKIPRHLEWTDALPKNANGKVLKHVLRDRLINRQKS
jgi:fatty-acyl-CoA synthase